MVIRNDSTINRMIEVDRATGIISTGVVHTPQDALASYTGVTEPTPAEPVKLPEDTELYDVFDFTGKAYWRFKNLLIIDLSIALIVSGVALFFSYALLNTLVGAGAGVIVLFFLAARLPKRTTRLVVIVSKDEQGKPWLDGEKWWKDEYIKWPDAPQVINAKGVKELWLDNTNGSLKVFNPWEGPEPKTDKTSADIIKQEALNQSGKTLAMYRAKSSLIAKYGIQLIVIGGALLALFMAANRTQEVFSGDVTQIPAGQTTAQGTP